MFSDVLNVILVTLPFSAAIFTSFTNFSDHVYFPLQHCAVAEATKLQKMTVTLSHQFSTSQIFDTDFWGDIFYL